MGCVKETPQRKKRRQHRICKRNALHKNQDSRGCVRETPEITKEASTGCVRETPQIKMKPSWDV